MNPAKDLAHKSALGAPDVPKTETDARKEIPAERALDKEDVINPPEGVKPDQDNDTF